ncbi:MAG TPA: RHS repeat-associated core domain-containing protein [Ktedonobacteraceae bacterium]|nr:RHS repeat-associated core domain-containing protein [Ktedonobacteraceae bacterium]
MAAFSNAVGAATLADNQVYGPYGNLLYSANGSMGTAKGYTGQYSDPLTGLDYYVSRYYDPVAGIFLSADTKEGNAQGMNPYAYVAQNPETLTDPSGQMVGCPGCGDNGDGGSGSGGSSGGGNSCGDNGCNPTPPPPTPQPHAPGHGYTPPGQCSEGSGMCNGNNTGCNASHIGAMVCGSPSSGNQPGGGCDQTCAAHDKQLIQQHEDLVIALTSDLYTLGMYVISALADWGLDQFDALPFDLANIVAQGLLVIRDIAALNGGIPAWLSTVTHFAQMILGTVDMVRGALVFIGGIGGLLDSFSFVKGAFTMVKQDIAGFMNIALTNFLGGASNYTIGAMGLQEDNLSSLSPQDLHDQCLAEHLAGCM